MEPVAYRTHLSIVEDRWYIDGRLTYPGSEAAGLLLNVRMVNACAQEGRDPGFDATANTERFVACIPDYAKHGVRAFTIGLQGGYPGYEMASNSAFAPDGRLRARFLARVRRVVEAADAAGVAVLLSLFYQRQSAALRDAAALRRAVAATARWIRDSGYGNVLLEVANEYGHPGFAHAALRQPAGVAALIRLAKAEAPGVAVSASGLGDGQVAPEVAEASDFLTLHFNETEVSGFAERIAAAHRFGKPVLCNEDDKVGAAGVAALRSAVAAGCGWGYMDLVGNQTRPFTYEGARDDPPVFAEMRRLSDASRPAPVSIRSRADYFPPPEASGGWRTLGDRTELAARGVDASTLQALGDWNLTIQNAPPLEPSPIAFLAVVGGWIAAEQYDRPDGATRATWVASIGKSVSSCAFGLWMEDGRRQHGTRLELESPVYSAGYLPEGLPLSDPRKEGINFWHLLTHTSGLRPEPDTRAGEGFRFVDYTVGKCAPFPNSERLAFPPGRGYGYSSVGFNHFSVMAPHICGRPLHQEVVARIFAPIGARSAHWRPAHPDGPADTGAGGPFITARDLARYAHLHLHDGLWAGRPIVPRWYLRAARAVWPACSAQPSDYGLGFWTNHNGGFSPALPRDAFAFGGSGLNVVVVVPSWNLIVVRTSRVWSMDMQPFVAEFARRIATLVR